MSDAKVLSLAEHIDERTRVTRVERLTVAGCVLGAVCLIAIAGLLLLPRIHEQRKKLELVVTEDTMSDMPPSIAIPSALMSTFRGMVLHFLWIRSAELKEDGKFYELQQLMDWICNLQPRFAKVWANNAWNLSYNISVATYSPRERWHWVSAGLYLLRDRGIPYNPKSIELYKELAWIYLHKMGDFMDDHHRAYKRNWAVIMEKVLGQPPVDPEGEESVSAIQVIAESAAGIEKFGPLTQKESLLAYIQADSEKSSMNDFLSELRAIGYEPDASFLEAVARYGRRGLQLHEIVVESEAKKLQSEQAKKLAMLLENEKWAAARDRLLAAVRAHVLKTDLKLDAAFMVKQMEKYGPLDWRAVFSHGLYWSALGSEICQGMVGIDENVEMNTDRLIQFGLKDNVERGHLIFEPNFDDPFESYIDFMPDARYVEVLQRLYLEQAVKHEDKDEEGRRRYYEEGPAGRLFKSGHVNFLHAAVRAYFLEGRMEKAQYYYDYLRENYKHPNGQVQEQYLVPLEQFALSDYLDAITSFKQGPVLIGTMLQTCFMNLAYDRSKPASQYLFFARKGYEKFMEDKESDRLDRRKLPPWPQLYANAWQNFLNNTRLPANYEVLLKARAWRRMDNEAKLEIFRHVEPTLRELCQANQPEIDFAKAFPEPVGLAEFEAQRATDQPTDGAQTDDIKKVTPSEGTKR